MEYDLTFEPAFVVSEANKFTLHGYINTTYDAASSFLSSLLFISKVIYIHTHTQNETPKFSA